MLAPRSSHLVERAAERLRQSGVLEDSAAHLLEPGHGGGSTVLPPRQPDPVPPPAGLDSLPANMLAPEPLAPAMLDQGSGVPSRAPASRSGVVLDMASLERARAARLDARADPDFRGIPSGATADPADRLRPDR